MDLDLNLDQGFLLKCHIKEIFRSGFRPAARSR